METPCVRVPREAGERVRRELAAADLLDYDFEIHAAEGWVYIPVVEPDAAADAYDVVLREAPPRDTQTMPTDLLDFEPTYERLADIILLEEDDPERARAAAAAFMASDLPVKTVVNKASEIRGDERVREWDVLAGDGTETVYREYGCEFALDIATVYFSPRLATERHRIVEQVADGERVFDMFCGVGPFAIPMAKRGATVVGVDINPDAIEYFEANARRNGVAERITAIEGDVREVADGYGGWADRIVMNLPHSADRFLDTAVSLAGGECVVHFYDIQGDDDPFGPGTAAIREAAAPEYDVTMETEQVVRSYSPHEVNVCIDARLRSRDA